MDELSSASANAVSLPKLSARRLLLLGGIALIVAGMLFGDFFAVFVLHQNAARVGTDLAAASNAALQGDEAAVAAHFTNVGSFLENRGTKVDAHVHAIEFGYLALLFAVVTPWIAFSERTKRAIAWTFLIGSALLPVGVFLIHYIGLAHSPLQSIGWASIFADAGGVAVLAATLAYFVGLWKHFRDRREAIAPDADALLHIRTAAGKRLLTGGLVLILLGFAGGAYYAVSDLYRQEAQDHLLLSNILTASVSGDISNLNQALASYGDLQGDKAVKIAAHAHIIEFGLLAMILSIFQPYVRFSETWMQRWAWTLLVGSIILPVCVLFELRFGLLAGGLADFGGLLVIVALIAMWIGIARYIGNLDSRSDVTP
jgi:NO-binding membrane sensor protein with MHYT domain